MDMEVNEDQENGSNLERLVHLDLKGAPPKISYYEELFALFEKWGATGLLIEYEDMFPYQGDLQELATVNAYSQSDIEKIKELAAKHKLQIIPLVQTFGHFEFVLKHDRFRSLRELPQYPMALCPLKEEALAVVTQMIDQVIRMHPHSKFFHIGADEVFHLGICPRCIQHQEKNKVSKMQLFFNYMLKVLQYVKNTYKDVQCIMWDDMFRDCDSQTIQDSGIGNLVEPMVWYYQKTIHLPEGMWDQYSKAFTRIWCASAFKGATGPSTYVTDIGYHVENHQEWLRVMKQEAPKFETFRGYAITGWQRYDHYSMPCELLPVGLPSLALNLLVLKSGAFTKEVHQAVTDDLGFAELMPLNPYKNFGVVVPNNFPGCTIHNRMHILLIHTTHYKVFLENERMNGWMTDYHIRKNFTNPAHLEFFLPEAKRLHGQFTLLQRELDVELRKIFFDDTVEEILSIFLVPPIKKLAEILETIDKQISFLAKPKDRLE